MRKQLVTLLSIAGSDCSGGAGIQADIHAASLCKVFPMTVVTAVTSQCSRGIDDIMPVSPISVKSQLRAVSSEATPSAIKIGMIGSVKTGEIIANYLHSIDKNIPIVIDPVLMSTTGHELASDKTSMMEFMIKELLPLATAVTPNLKEAGLFLNDRTCLDTDNQKAMEEICSRLFDMFNSYAVILKGGHMNSPEIFDVMVSRNRPDSADIFISERIGCKNLHGTGCTYASILASLLAKGLDISSAFHSTGDMIRSIILNSIGYDLGVSGYGPLNVHGYAGIQPV